ncbi:MAG: hypothetical protein IJ409_05325 [Lachnospiraceae bacterium]|nr:hypothetical protein [Lachnospiraceae bacterium]
MKKILKRLLAAFCGVLLLLVAAFAVYFFLLRQEPEEASISEVATEVVEVPEAEPEVIVDMGQSVLDHIVTAGSAVEDAYEQRPPEVNLADMADVTSFADITSCQIDAETGKIKVTMEADGLPQSDDKFYYLMEMNTYDRALPEGSQHIDRVYKDSAIELWASLNNNSASSRLYKKFVVAVKLDGKYVPVTTPEYITNPEVIAKHTSVYKTPASKKGLLVDPNKLRGNELDDLGVKQAAYNIPVARILGPSTSPHYATVYYTYNGNTYAFNGAVIAEYDLVFSTLTAKGITTTAIILNNCKSSYQQLTHPDARSGSTAPYYMFNGEEQAGVEYMAAIGTFLADRYSDTTHGKVSNWVIANEINARKEWNYMAYTDIETYVAAYERAFRVFYTAIKSQSSTARVYMPIDQQWDRDIKNNTNYDGRDVLDVFSRLVAEKGDIDWGLSQHPYNVPLTEARTWKSSKYIEHNSSTSMISMANIEVLINYMHQDYLLSPSGEVRSILLSEQGYTSTAGEAYQAAAFAYAYYKCEYYEDIDGFLLNRQTDAPEEVAQGLAFGLNHVGGGRRKQIYNVFKYIDTPQHAEYTDFAKDLIGISSWSEIMR